jgi:hypothetical protein
MLSLNVFNDLVRTVDASGVTVEVTSNQGWVSINAPDSEGVFLQGDEGYDFVEKAREVWDELQEVTMEDAYKFRAYDYLDLL